MSTKKYILNVYTNWCGEYNNFSAIVDDEHMNGFENIANLKAYDNFYDFDGPNSVLEDLFPEHDYEENYSDEELDEAEQREGEYYGYTIEEYNEDSHGEWDWYDLIYDCTEEWK